MDWPIPEKEFIEDVRKVTAEKIRIHSRYQFPANMVLRGEIFRLPEKLGAEFAWQLETYVLGNKTQETLVSSYVRESVKTPNTWWDMFKVEHFPQWLRERFPAKYHLVDIVVNETKNITHNYICPHLEADEDRLHWAFFDHKVKA